MEVKEACKFLEEIAEFTISREKESKAIKIKALLKSLEAENKKLKQENEAYKGMWEILSGIANRETDTSFESELFSIITRIENHYLGGGE
jgi:cell shape-determining protein MreC